MGNGCLVVAGVLTGSTPAFSWPRQEAAMTLTLPFDEADMVYFRCLGYRFLAQLHWV